MPQPASNDLQKIGYLCDELVTKDLNLYGEFEMHASQPQRQEFNNLVVDIRERLCRAKGGDPVISRTHLPEGICRLFIRRAELVADVAVAHKPAVKGDLQKKFATALLFPRHAVAEKDIQDIFKKDVVAPTLAAIISPAS